ncbi:MAG: small multi-drug export protein, partial [Candidatus Altiarchaeota archaeon]|nr:small multi-drug export protein [Candidatus Altiarchaeota archaeon]
MDLPFSGLAQNPFLYVALITTLPWIELRGGIPAGLLLGLSPLSVFTVSVIANCAIIYPSFIFLDWFFHIMKKVGWLGRMIDKTHEKAKPYVDRYGVLGLMLFVA